LHARLPILVDAPLEGILCLGDLVRVRRLVVVVEGVGAESVEVGSVGGLSAFGEKPEVLEDVILCVGADPLSDVVVNRRHHPGLGLLDSEVQSLGLAVTLVCGRGMAYGTIRIHPDDRLSRLVFGTLKGRRETVELVMPTQIGTRFKQTGAIPRWWFGRREKEEK
jgi:hypothetical protein